jgi:subtilase family serine protease
MFRHGFAVIALSLLTALSASAEIKSTNNTPDLVAVDVSIDDSGALVAVIQNSGIAINSTFQAALSLDGHTTRTFAFGSSTRGQTPPPVGGRGGVSAANLALPFQQGERRTLKFSDVGVDCSGQHSLKLNVDTGGTISEVSEANNEKPKTMASPCPDLAVQSISKNWNRIHTQYVAEVIVINQGTGKTSPFSVATQATPGTPLGSLPGGGATQYSPLAPGQTLKLTTGAAHAIESLRVKVWLDVGNVVKESNEDNNVVERLLKP